MAGPFDLTGQNIENTYQRVLQTPDGATFYDGTGSLVTLPSANVSNLVTTSSFNAFTSSINTFTSSYNTGSFSGSFTGSLNGTASYALNGGVTSINVAGTGLSINQTTGNVIITGTGGGGGGNTATGSYGSFYSTVTQTNVANTARSMSLNVTDISNGVSISGSTNPYNTYIKTENPGIYDIQFSAQVDKTDSGTDEMWIWLRKNGVNVDDSATSVQLIGNGAHYVAAWNFFVNAAANDYYQLMWYSPDANVRLHAEAGFGVVPGIPSLIVTVNRVDQFLSNTGSFTGSFTGVFTGSLLGTASTASYYRETDPIFTAKSASLATTGSNNFKGNQNITGSLAISGGLGLTVANTDGNSLDTYNRWLIANTFLSVDWGNRTLNDSSGNSTVNWTNKTLIDGNLTASVDWGNKFLNRFNGSSYVPSIDWNSQFLYADDGSTPHIGWNSTNYMEFPSTIESPITRVLGMDDNNRVYWTSSNAIGGGGSNIPAFPYTGSAIISGSLIVTGSTTSTLGFTGSLFGTASWADNALTSSRLNAANTSIFAASSNRMTITASNGIIMNAGSVGVNLESGITITGNVLPGPPITNNTSSWSLGSPTLAWKDLYVSNGSVYFISGSTSASIGFNNGTINFDNATVNIPAGSTVPTASFAQTASLLNTATTVGQNLITLSNPTAVRYLKINADNSVTTLTAAQLQNDLGKYRTTLASDVSITAANTTVVDITGLSFPITAGKKYKFKATLLYGASSGTQGLRIGINADVGANAVYYMTTQVSSNTPAATAFVSFNSTAFNSVSQNTVASLTAGIAFIEGYIDANNTGTVIGRFSKGANNAGTLTIRSGSFIDYEEFL